MTEGTEQFWCAGELALPLKEMKKKHDLFPDLFNPVNCQSGMA